MIGHEDTAIAAGLAQPHHDGSELYVLERPDRPGGEATVRLRLPADGDVEGVYLRHVQDGEPRAVEAVLDEEGEGESWLRATFPVTAETARYRWLLDRGEHGYSWLNGAGVVATDVGDQDDFVLPLDPGGPDWHLGSVVYEIFPDRFARHGSAGLDDLPDWAVPRPWDAWPDGGGTTNREWFGGDLPGIEQRLDHVTRLGANVLYLTPFFPARSTHRYDASSFDLVDPLLGGDEALDSLLSAAHGRGIRVVGDLTLNHIGAGHDWFREAREYAHVPERRFFYWDDDAYSPHGYQTWLGVRSLPKLDWADEELRRRMLDVARRWLREGLDGWRIDVANMVARHGAYDANAEVARLTRAAVMAERPDGLLIAEHGHDFRSDAQGGGWHGVMNYTGFLRPVWSWLRRDDLPPRLRKEFWALPVGLAGFGGREVVETMRELRSGVPWQSVLHSWTLVDSHDVARFRTVTGSRERQLVGVGLQMTTPGVPMVFAGDEIGLEGEWGEDARRTMPWDRIETWDGPLLEEYRVLVALRRSSDALARGGIRYLHVSDDAIAYLRESRSERLLCLAARAPHEPIVAPFAGLETLYGEDAAGGVLPADGPAFHVWRITDG